jgi:hypothetical protein
MRESASWKTMFCVLALMAGLAPLRADDPQPLQSTLAQLALLDKITGIGSLKFGASFDSFDKADLTYVGNPGVPTADYLYTTSDQITWGTLVPNGIALTFYYNELVGITLHFNETNATLISVKQAFVQKYGASTSDVSSAMPVPRTTIYITSPEAFGRARTSPPMSLCRTESRPSPAKTSSPKKWTALCSSSTRGWRRS